MTTVAPHEREEHAVAPWVHDDGRGEHRRGTDGPFASRCLRPTRFFVAADERYDLHGTQQPPTRLFRSFILDVHHIRIIAKCCKSFNILRMTY